MPPLSALLHLLNFAAPALCLAVAAVLVAPVVMPRSPAALAWPKRLVVDGAVGVAILGAGLALTGSDGRMLTWAALVLGVASSEWLLRRGWR